MTIHSHATETGDISIAQAHGSEAEARTHQQLRGLLDRYDLRPWQWTDSIVIDETAIPHGHPVLTLHTRHLDDDVLLLSTYLHEQLHWFISAQPAKRIEPTIADLKQRYPNVPVGFPRCSSDPLSSYFHYVICYLEYLSLRRLVDETEARRAMIFWRHDHYTEIYQTVLGDMDAIAEIVAHYGLLPPVLTVG
ncbi:MAG: hypothetical protein ACR2GA_03725 [Chloroflexota bacterium]